jgi:competence protein ComEC
MIGIIFLLYKYRPGWPKIFHCFLLGLLFFLLGQQHSKAYLEPPTDPRHLYNLIENKQSVSIGGVLTKHPSVFWGNSGPETKLIVEAKTLFTTPGLKGKNKLPGNINGLVQLTLKGILPENIRPGDHFLARAKLSRIYTFSTPGSFNYKSHLASQAILVKGCVQSPANIMKLHFLDSSAFRSGIHTLRFFPERIRHSIAFFLDNTLEQPARGLYKAILIGDRSDVSSSVQESFTAAGCIHLLAISGVHMGLLALVITAILTWLLKRSQWVLLSCFPLCKIVATSALFPLFLYALIAGFNIPVLRAFLMAAVLLFALLADRPGNLLNHILLAAFLIMVWNPTLIYTASFQLSFSAVIAIALVSPLLYNLIARKYPSSHSSNPTQKTNPSPMASAIKQFFKFYLIRWLLVGIAVTATATLGTLPLLVFHFNRLSLTAPISNLLVEPLICFWALLIGLFASLCIPLVPLFAKVLFAIGGAGLMIAEKICTFFSSLPHASLWLPTPSLLEIAIFYVFLVSAILAFRLGKRTLFLGVAILCLFSLGVDLTVVSLSKQASEITSVSILDVGHGSSFLLQLPHNQNILIDGGGSGNDHFNIGERVIAPFLWKKRLQSLNAVIITHPHADHYNGLPFILSHFHPKTLWIGGVQEYENEYRHLLDLAAQLGIEIRNTQTDEILFQEGKIRLQCIAGGFPVQNKEEAGTVTTQYKTSNPNDMSLVLRLDTSDKSFLFPADIDAATADILVASGQNVKANVLLAPHHGSSSSMSHSFIENVDPEFIAISAGRNNPFNFPDESFYDLRKNGIEILSTGSDGTLTFTVVNYALNVSRYQIN